MEHPTETHPRDRIAREYYWLRRTYKRMSRPDALLVARYKVEAQLQRAAGMTRPGLDGVDAEREERRLEREYQHGAGGWRTLVDARPEWVARQYGDYANALVANLTQKGLEASNA